MEKRKKANPNCLQLSLGSKQNAVNLILNGHDKNFQISFGSKDGKKSKILCPGQRQTWIPPPGKTTRGKRKSCCFYNDEIMLSLPDDGKFVLPYGLPLIIESQHLENFKAALYPPRSDSASVYSCDSFEDQAKRIRQSYEKQYTVVKESEKLLKEHNSRRKVLLKHITLLKRNLEEINKSIQEIESDVTEAQRCSKRSSFDAKKTKSYASSNEAKILENLMKRKEKMRGKEKFESDIPSNLSAERAMMNLADSMRKSKLLLDNTLQEEEAINELQTKYIQGVEELYEGQQRLLKRICQALDVTSSSDEDRNVDDNASGCCVVDPELQLCHKTEKLNSLPDLANYLQNQNLAEKLTSANFQIDKLKEELESIKMKSQENSGQLDMNSRQMISSRQKQSEKNISETTLTHKTKTISYTPENENIVPGNFPAENLASLCSTQKAMEKLKETLEKIIPIMPKESQMTPVFVSHHEESMSIKPVDTIERKRDEKMDRDRSNTQAGSSNDEVRQSDENASHPGSGTTPAAEREDGYRGSSEVAHKGSSGVEIECVDELPENQTDEDNGLIIARRNQAQHRDPMTSTLSDHAKVIRRPRIHKKGRSVQLSPSTFKPKNESTRLSLASRRASILPKQQSISYRKKASVTGRPDVSEEFFPNLDHVRSSELNETGASSSLSDADSGNLLDEGFIEETPVHMRDRFSDAKSRIRDPEGKLVPGTSQRTAYKEPLNDLNTRIDSNNRFSEYISERDDRRNDLNERNDSNNRFSEYISEREDRRNDLNKRIDSNNRLSEYIPERRPNDTEEKSGYLTYVNQRIKPPKQISRDDDKPKLGTTSSREKYQENTSSKSSINDTNDRLISGFISNVSQYEVPPPDNEISNSNDELVSGFLPNTSSKSTINDSNDRLISGFISNTSQYEIPPPDNEISNSNDELVSGFLSNSSQYEDPSDNSRVDDENERQITSENREHSPVTGQAKQVTPGVSSHVPLQYGAPLVRVDDIETVGGNDSEEWHVPELYYGSLDSSAQEPEYVGNSTSSPRRSKVNRGVDIDNSPGSEHWYRLDSYHGSSLSPSALEEEVFYNGYPENGVTRQPERDLLNSTHDRQKLRSKSIPVSYDRYGNEVRPGYERMGQNGLRNYPHRRVTYHTAGIPNTRPKFYDLHQFPAIRKDPNIRSKSVATPLHSSARYNKPTPRRHTLDWNNIQQRKIRNLYNEIMR